MIGPHVEPHMSTSVPGNSRSIGALKISMLHRIKAWGGGVAECRLAW